ncbi:MAG TPA: hypothetical protein VK750_01520, partial [Cytophagaceae bacterium]|nr:hypothetical protein [Cytophagaceae bacterium]
MKRILLLLSVLTLLSLSEELYAQAIYGWRYELEEDGCCDCYDRRLVVTNLVVNGDTTTDRWAIDIANYNSSESRPQGGFTFPATGTISEFSIGLERNEFCNADILGAPQDNNPLKTFYTSDIAAVYKTTSYWKKKYPLSANFSPVNPYEFFRV